MAVSRAEIAEGVLKPVAEALDEDGAHGAPLLLRRIIVERRVGGAKNKAALSGGSLSKHFILRDERNEFLEARAAYTTSGACADARLRIPV